MSKKPPPQDQSNSRNEYIPSYITKAPFYAEGLSDGDYLEHQRLHATPKDTLDKAKWYERGRKVGPAATKFRKGACENCGAMSHKTKDCLERPRKHGARWTGRDIQADEVLADVKLGWDAKRDRWNGYDAREYSAVVKEYEDMEKLRQGATTSSSASAKHLTNPIGEDDNEPDNDKAEAKYAEETDMGRSQPTSTRQLRLREDTAKYLLNLDLDSAQYDPKTRSMDTTTQSLSNGASDSIAEEGFIRPSSTSDDAAAFERAQKYAWETQESAKNANAKMLHLQANPTEGELLLKKQTDDTTAKKAAQRKALIDKYGDQPHLQPSNINTTTTATPNPSTGPSSSRRAITASESYVEYDKHGNPKLPAGQTRSVPRSKYPEDIHTNNHTSVFGSWWASFTWGYACCHSTVKNSYCTGDAGKTAFEEAQHLRTGQTLLPNITGQNGNGNDAEDDQVNDKENVHRVDRDEDKANQSSRERHDGDIHTRKDGDGDGSNVGTERRGTKKRPFGFGDGDSGVTEEELEAYKRSKTAADDPMRAWGKMGDDGLLEHGATTT